MVKSSVSASDPNLQAYIYMDVNGESIIKEKVTDALISAAANGTLEAFEVDKDKFTAHHKIVGKSS